MNPFNQYFKHLVSGCCLVNFLPGDGCVGDTAAARSLGHQCTHHPVLRCTGRLVPLYTLPSNACMKSPTPTVNSPEVRVVLVVLGLNANRPNSAKAAVRGTCPPLG
jgi:hypothetical protein